MRLNHLHLRVTDVNRSEPFYVRNFGFRRHAVHGSGIVFLRDAGGLDLALAPAQTIEPLPAWFHFGFRLESAAAVRAKHSLMCGDGIPLLHPLEEEEDGFTWFRAADPDGYQIEIYWEPEPR